MFSKQIIRRSIENLPSNSHNEFDLALLDFDLNNKGINLNGSIQYKKSQIIKFLISNPNTQDNHGELITLRLVNRLVSRMLKRKPPFINGFDEESMEFIDDRDFYKYLRFDG